MKKLLFFVAFSLYLFCRSTEALAWREVTSIDSVTLPGDLYFQTDYRVQWWYFTGHLYDRNGRAFGFELTFFVAGVQQRRFSSAFGVNDIYLTNFAISDVEGKKFFHFSNADSGAYGFAGADSKRLHVWVGKDSLKGNLKKMQISAREPDAELDLVLIPKKSFVLNGSKGYSRKSEESPLIASLYFSCTDLETTGTIKLGTTLFTVHGKSWFDRELSSHGLAKNEVGWDWFSIQLDDGREIMLYELRKQDGSVDRYSSGTIVDIHGSSRRLSREDYQIEAISSYNSKKSGIRYPDRWKITIPKENLRLLVTPLLMDQEFIGDRSIEGSYWEGACTVEGTAQGQAYAELTGYQ